VYVLGGQPRHCILHNASRGLSATAEIQIFVIARQQNALACRARYLLWHFCLSVCPSVCPPRYGVVCLNECRPTHCHTFDTICWGPSGPSGLQNFKGNSSAGALTTCIYLTVIAVYLGNSTSTARSYYITNRHLTATRSIRVTYMTSTYLHRRDLRDPIIIWRTYAH